MPDIKHETSPPQPQAKPDQQTDQDNDHIDDQEKILAGRYDVNYPALLTKDVAGG